MSQKPVYYLKKLSIAKSKQVKGILKKAPLELIRIISEISLNAVNGNIKLSPKQLKILQKNYKILNLLAQKKVPLKLKRKLLIQRGGFFPALLAGLIPTILGAIINR